MAIIVLFFVADVILLYSCCIASKRADEMSERIIIENKKRDI